MASQFPSGPLPTDIRESVRSIIKEVGVAGLKKGDIYRRLAAKYQIEFNSHAKNVDAVLKDLLKSSEFKDELKKAVENEKQCMGGKGRARSPSPKEKNSKRSKPEKPEKAEKAKKPDNYPKRPSTAYIFFSNEHRVAVMQENPGSGVPKISQELGRMWGELTDEGKKKYLVMAEKDKARFEREMQEYTDNGGEEYSGKRASSSKKKPKDENAPKRSKNAYMFFSNAYRMEHKDLAMKDALREAGAAWKELSAAAKAPYEAMAAEDKKRYETEKAEQRN